MAKVKNGGSVQNKAIYTRASFLHQAAAFLSSSASNPDAKDSSTTTTTPALPGMARRLVTDLRSVSLKTRIRLTPAMKQTICKYCDSILIEGQSCTSTIENRSKNGRKPWADVLVRKCHTCQRERRYPVDAPRQKRKTERDDQSKVEKAAQAG
ncbi:ribonuclease P protein component 4 [Echria macrotheca]|uniref:Ribonuclease P protein component 4 n=1 Tax=Echria macrotheca TaxID=438768 RepID=A0AAJ0F7X2_9PEZI|nr:ribonuclease P protein component 4 [Echria macrotheca]